MSDTSSTVESALPPEARLVLACAASVSASGTAAAERVFGRIARGIDWELFLRIARWHCVTPLMHRALGEARAAGAAVPESAVSAVRDDFYSNAFQNIRLLNELGSFLKLAESNGIEVVVLKGPALAMMAYGDLAMRQFADIDVLVRRSDLSIVRELAGGRDRRPCAQAEASSMPDIFRAHSQEFFADSSNASLDVHWRLSPGYFRFEPDLDAIRARSIQIQAGGVRFRSFAAEDLFLFQCVHASKHGWSRLGWICDVGWMIRSQPRMNWDAILSEARQTRSLRSLFVGAFLAEHLLGIRAPDAVLAAARASKAVEPIAARVTRYLFGEIGYGPSLYQEWILPCACAQGVRGKLRYLLGRALLPTPEDWRLMPSRFYPLYFLLRPMRLAVEQGPRLFRRAVQR